MEPQAMLNWAGNYRYGRDEVLRPRSVAELQETVRGHARIKTLGSRHCFNGIADSRHCLMSLDQLEGEAVLDRGRGTVSVPGEMTYGRLCPWLHEHGVALHNLASLPHISVAGACATGTHGSGVRNGNLATAVGGFEMVAASGELWTGSYDDGRALFSGMPVHLGALGVVTRVHLRVEPEYRVRQLVYEGLPAEVLEERFDEIVAAGHSVSLFTGWRNRRIDTVWIKERVSSTAAPAAPSEWLGATLATRNLHPLEGESAESCTEQGGLPGTWFERLPHFKMEFTPSRGAELQSEYFVALENGMDAIHAIERLREAVCPHLLITELRTVAADELWMSPCFRRASLAIHFTWKPDWPSVREVLPRIEQELSHLAPRPHWGKLFTMDPAVLRSRYERLPDFVALARQMDPTGKFRNEFLERYLFSN